MKMFQQVVILSVALFGYTAGVDTANGERVGGCPTNVTSIGSRLDDECNVDNDCTRTSVQKCCPDNFGIKVCVNPIPACRDGQKISEWSLLDGSCAELAAWDCMDRGCEDGPEGPGGWKGACCGGYAFQWNGSPRPTCGGNKEPLKDSEDYVFWCSEHSLRPCPENSTCVTDPSGYHICCPSSGSGTTTSVTKPPMPPTLPPSAGYPCDAVTCFPRPNCPGGKIKEYPERCCTWYECIQEPSQNPVCVPGDRYDMPEEPCKSCICGDDGHPTTNCAVMMCDIRICPQGQWAKHVPGTCCAFDCVDYEKPTEPTADICSLPIVEGDCRAYMPSWGFNKQAGACQNFVYGGCGGNDNRFLTEEACKSACGKTVDACSLPIEEGDCRADLPSWGFNQQTKTCVLFSYSGCGGNTNNFLTKEACESACGENSENKKKLEKVHCVTETNEQIQIGDSYTPENKPCSECFCTEDAELQCVTKLCSPPKCEKGQSLEHSDDSCCASCVNNSKALIDEEGSLTQFGLIIVVVCIALFLGLIIAIGVACYYRRKNRSSTIYLDNYYNNLTYSDSKDLSQKSEKVENMYESVEEVNHANVRKEKEVLGNTYSNV